jgi:hypothetical protein
MRLIYIYYIVKITHASIKILTMKHLSLDIVNSSGHPYPDILNGINITMRGTKNLFDIFFSVVDIEVSFQIDIPNQIDFTWINTPSGKDKYISYPTLKRLLFQLKGHSPLVQPYLAWVDSLLFSNSRIKPFFRSVSSPPAKCGSGITIRSSRTDDTVIDDFSDISEIDDNIDSASLLSFETQSDQNALNAMQQRIVELEYALQLKDKDIDILHRDVQVRDKEIEILQMKLLALTTSKWV